MAKSNNFVYYEDALRIFTSYASAIKDNRHQIANLEKVKAAKVDLARIYETTATATQAISKGTYFYLNNVLAQAKIDIAIGDTFTEHTNYELITEGTLNDLNSDITELEVKVPFKFGIDTSGNYGYYKAGADTVTPFNSKLPVKLNKELVETEYYIIEPENYTNVIYHIDINFSYQLTIPYGFDVLHPDEFTPEKDGYDFYGWKDSGIASPDVLQTLVASGDTMHVYCVFARQSPFTTILYNGSTTPTIIDHDLYYNNGDVLQPELTLSEVALGGWTKIGWTTKDDEYTMEIADGTVIPVTSNETYYSLYSKDVTLTTYDQYNTPSSDTKTRYVNYHSSGTYINPSWVLTEGSVGGWGKFGWTNDINGYTATISDGDTLTLTDDDTYYPLYNQVVNCSVHGSDKSTWPSWYTDTGNIVLNVHDTTTRQNPTFGPYNEYSMGWTKRGWTKATSGGSSAIAFADGGTVTLTADASYYACYSRTVTVSYNANGGSGTMPAGTDKAYYHSNSGATNANITIASNSYTRSNYNFVQWRLNSVSGTIYAPGATYSSTEDATMYAEWKVKAVAKTFNYTGGMQSYVAYAGVTYKIQCYGAQGGNVPTGAYAGGTGGYGGYSIGYRTPSTDETWYVCVGGQGSTLTFYNSDSSTGERACGGYNGGGHILKQTKANSGQLSGGGGASHVSLSNTLLQNTAVGNLIICAGGGGGNASVWWGSTTYGGTGGGTNGGAGSNPSGGSGASTCGGGGTQTAGGTNSVTGSWSSYVNGSYGKGGDGLFWGDGYRWATGGGGGGYYGGAGGATYNPDNAYSAGGGGSGNCRGTTSSSMSNGQKSGNGQVIITPME